MNHGLISLRSSLPLFFFFLLSCSSEYEGKQCFSFSSGKRFEQLCYRIAKSKEPNQAFAHLNEVDLNNIKNISEGLRINQHNAYVSDGNVYIELGRAASKPILTKNGNTYCIRYVRKQGIAALFEKYSFGLIVSDYERDSYEIEQYILLENNIYLYVFKGEF